MFPLVSVLRLYNISLNKKETTLVYDQFEERRNFDLNKLACYFIKKI